MKMCVVLWIVNVCLGGKKEAKMEMKIEMGRELGNKDVVGDYEKIDHRHCTQETKILLRQ